LHGYDIEISFVPPALHVDYKKLKEGILTGLASIAKPTGQTEQKILLFYGSMCHPDLAQMAGESGAIHPREGNCIDMFLSPGQKKEIEASENVFFMTGGWFKHWREIFQQGQGWDTIDARINFGRYDKILILDSGSHDISEEEIFEFYDYIQVPIDIEPITLDYFKSVVTNICREVMNVNTVTA
jgi:hypothetical protein